MSKERGIIQSAEQVRQWLAGTRTQFRVLVKPQPELIESFSHQYPPHGTRVSYGYSGWYPNPHAKNALHYSSMDHFLKGFPYEFSPYKPGDKLWVRETWCPLTHGSYEPIERSRKVRSYYDCSIAYAADPVYGFGHCWDEITPNWRSSATMPRWASRIVREITCVRVERAEQDDPVEKIKAGQWVWVIETKGVEER